MSGDGLTEDYFLGGRILVRQRRDGYRAAIDPILLAAAVTNGERLMEAGCGAGTALLAAATRLPEARFLGVERDVDAAALAAENVRANGLEARIEIRDGDALTLDAETFDGVFFNPPFLMEGEGRPPAEARSASRVADQPLDRWIAALSNKLAGGGALTFIHRADRLGEALAGLDGRLGGVRVLPIHPKADAPANRIIVRAVKGSRARPGIEPGLVLHDASGAFMPRTAAILRGEGGLPWP